MEVKQLSREAIAEKLSRLSGADANWRDGSLWAYIYDAGCEVEEVCTEAFSQFLFTNALDPTVFPSVVQLENDVVRAMCGHLHGEHAVGTFTSGGTESIFLALKCARDRARAQRPSSGVAEVVLAETAHAAFHKAAHYLGMRVVQVAVDPQSFRAQPAAMAAAITPNTAVLVGSAPSYAHGVVDPIAELAELAVAHDLWLHVDACVGGVLLPYWRESDPTIPAFDFSPPGVCSLSVDLHKYGFAAKGASLCLFRDAELRRYQYFACARWSGYALVNAAVQSSRSAGPLAGAWAVLHLLGDAGYRAHVDSLREATARLVAAIEAMDGLRMLGRPDMNVLAFAGAGVNVFHVVDEMAERGWMLQPQLRYGVSPESVHLCMTPVNAQRTGALIADLQASVEAARGLPDGQLAGMLESLFPAGGAKAGGLGDIDDAMLVPLLEAVGIDGAQLPERMAPIHELLNALDPAMRERVLTLFMERLFS